MRSKLLTGSSLIFATALMVAANVGANIAFKNVRLDLTQGQLYTLSDGTKNILSQIPDTVRLRLYYSARAAAELPAIQTHGQRVQDMLQDFARRSNGKIQLEIIDPEPFSDEEDRAVMAGLSAAPMPNGGQGFYFGLTGSNLVGDQETIPFFTPDRALFLEYDLAKFIHTLSQPKRSDVAVLSSLPLDFGPGGPMAAVRGQSQPYAAMQMLRQNYNVRTLDGTIRHIDPDIGVAVLAHPRDLTDQALYAVDQFVMRGGRLIVLLDPWSETGAMMPNPMTGAPTGQGAPQPELVAMLKRWGIEIASEQFVADLGLAQRVNTGRGGAQAVVNYLPWLAVTPAQMDKTDVISAPIENLNLASAGHVRLADGANLTLTPLVQSTTQAMLKPVADLQGQPDPEGLLEKFQPTGERYVLAARIEGTLKTAFPDGAPKNTVAVNPGNAQNPMGDMPHRAETEGKANILIVADVDFLDDRFWVQSEDLFGQRMLVPIAGNGDLLFNAVDSYAGSTDLISLRGRGLASRPLERFEEMRRNAAQAFLQQEKALEDKLRQTEQQLAEFQRANRAGQGLALTPEEQQAIDNFRAERNRIRRELRDVQRALNRDIENLQTNIRLINIAALPIAVAGIGVLFGIARRRKRRKA